MKNFYIILVIILLGAFAYFKFNSGNGEKCAYVYIFNPKTGSESDLDLKVDVENGQLVKIYFNNGGYLDEEHFKGGSTYISNDNPATFKDERGREFIVTLQDQENCDY